MHEIGFKTLLGGLSDNILQQNYQLLITGSFQTQKHVVFLPVVSLVRLRRPPDDQSSPSPSSPVCGGEAEVARVLGQGVQQVAGALLEPAGKKRGNKWLVS